MSNCFSVPSFRQHSHRNYGLNVFAGLANLADGVNGLAELFGAIFLAELFLWDVSFIAVGFILCCV